jgi:hypothetical protein
MFSPERFTEKTDRQETLRREFKRLRKTIHESMKVDAERRIKENPKPTEEELYLGVFLEGWSRKYGPLFGKCTRKDTQRNLRVFMPQNQSCNLPMDISRLIEILEIYCIEWELTYCEVPISGCRKTT